MEQNVNTIDETKKKLERTAPIRSRVHRKKPLKIVSESLDHISTNLWHSPIACGQGAGGDHRGGGADDVLAYVL